jgi:hemoglobin
LTDEPGRRSALNPSAGRAGRTEWDLDAIDHLPVTCDFWETVLFRAGLYRRNAFQAHRHIHGRTPLSANHFHRWLTLWNTTIDQMCPGPIAEHAKVQAARIASSMHHRLAGNDLAELGPRAATTAREFCNRPTETPKR